MNPYIGVTIFAALWIVILTIAISFRPSVIRDGKADKALRNSKVAVTAFFYLLLIAVASIIYPEASFGYGKVMGILFALMPFILFLFAIKIVFNKVSVVIINLLVKVP